jgi:hypothetical protein
MTRKIDLASAGTADLTRRFEEITLRMSYHASRLEPKKYNKCIKEMLDIRAELTSRGRRDALAALYTHEDAEVRYQAAMATLIVLPDRARKVLQQIVDRDGFPQAMNARGILEGLDDGSFVPS